MRARTALLAGMTAAAVVAAPAASFAYGPGGNNGSANPPGFGTTLSSRSIGANGGVVKGSTPKCHVKVTVAAGTFAKKTSVVISKIKNTKADKSLTKGSAVCSFGVGFFRNDNLVKSNPAAHVVFTGSKIKKGDHLYVLSGYGTASRKHATVKAGKTTVKLHNTLELSIVQS